MLPSAARLRLRRDFRSVLRGRTRIARRLVVVHYARRACAQGDDGPRAGLIVSRQVGVAVVRNRVKRRLRALLREHLAALPPGVDVVVRAQPALATASYAEIETDVASALHEVARRKTGTP